MSVTIRPFISQDAYDMDWIEQDDFIGLLRSNGRYFFDYLEQEYRYETMINNNTGHILCFDVFQILHKQHCNLYLYMGTAIQREFDKDIYRALSERVNAFREKYGRVSVVGKASNSKLMKLIKKLGFQEEGIMRKYGWHGEDYMLFSVVR